MQLCYCLIQQLEKDIINFLLRCIGHIFFRWHGSLHIVGYRNISVSVRLHGQQESIINTGDIECRMVIILIAEIECLDQLAVFRSAAVIIEMLPAAGRPSIRIRIGRRLIHKAADIVSPITGIDIMSQIGCCLIIIVRTFVGEVGKNTSDSTFHPFQTCHGMFRQSIINIYTVGRYILHSRVVNRCVRICIQFLKIMASGQSQQRT